MPASDLYNVRFETGAVTRDRPLPVASGNPSSATATIASSGTLSGAVDLGEYRLHRLAMPAAWTTAAITFSVSYDGVTYNDLYDANGEYTFGSSVVGASRSIIVDQMTFFGIRYVKVRSGTSAATVAQAASRDIILVTVPR